jgi:magnesium-transporting ATPase (P-type)
MKGVESGLKTNFKEGLVPLDFDDREEAFGNNKKAAAKRVSFFSLFFGALDDFMLKLLLVCACISIAIDVGFAEPEERSHCKILTDHFLTLILFLILILILI